MRRHLFARAGMVALALAVAAPGVAVAQIVSLDDWFITKPPPADTITESQFRGADPRYVETLRTIARAVLDLADGSATVAAGQGMPAPHLDAAKVAEARRLIAAYLNRHPDSPTATEMRDGLTYLDAGLAELTDDAGWESSQTLTRRMATPAQIRLDAESSYGSESTYTSTQQRAWGGGQHWWWQSDGTPGDARLVAAGDSKLEEGWPDVMMLASALARLTEAGSPATVREETDAGGRRVTYAWNLAAGSMSVVVDPARGYAPARWTQQLSRDRNAEYAAQMREMLASEDLDAESRALFEESLAEAESNTAPLSLETTVITFAPAPGAAWRPKRLECTQQEDYGGADVPAEFADDPELAEITRAMQSAFTPGTPVEWIEWRELRGAVSVQEAFVPPPGYEGYTGQRWVDLTTAPDPRDRDRLAEQLRAGLVLTPGQDIVGTGRWTVTYADDAVLGTWPVREGDVLLLAGCTCLAPIELEPDEEGRGPIDQIAAAIEEAEPGDPATLRVGRGDQIIDIVCWVPKSGSGADRLALQDAILQSHEYPPLPYEPATAFAQAVLDATERLVQ